MLSAHSHGCNQICELEKNRELQLVFASWIASLKTIEPIFDLGMHGPLRILAHEEATHPHQYSVMVT